MSPDPEQTVDPSGGPVSVLQERLGPEWHPLLAAIGVTRDMPSGSLSAVSERVLIAAEGVHPELHWTESLREELRWAWLAWWSEGRRPTSGESGPAQP